MYTENSIQKLRDIERKFETGKLKYSGMVKKVRAMYREKEADRFIALLHNGSSFTDAAYTIDQARTKQTATTPFGQIERRF